MLNEKEEKNIDADISERIEGFNQELKPLLGKFELLLAAEPIIMQDGRLAARPLVISARKPEPPATAVSPE